MSTGHVILLLAGFVCQGTASGLDSAGAWQGELTVAGAHTERVVLRISGTDAGGYRAVIYRIDEGGPPVAGTLTRRGWDVKVSIPALDATYEGTLDQKGGSIVGTWTQEGGRQHLLLQRATNATAWPIPPPVRMRAMAANAPARFEVASIKRTRPGVQGKGIGIRGRQISTANTSVSDLITFAYGVSARQIAGGPAWIATEKYNLTAKPEGEGFPNREQ